MYKPCPHLVDKMSCPLTLIWLRSWARAESACFLRCFPYRPGTESWGSEGLGCLACELELRVILVTEGWGAFLFQLDLDLFITTPVNSRKSEQDKTSVTVIKVSFPPCHQLKARFAESQKKKIIFYFLNSACLDSLNSP